MTGGSETSCCDLTLHCTVSSHGAPLQSLCLLVASLGGAQLFSTLICSIMQHLCIVLLDFAEYCHFRSGQPKFTVIDVV